MLNKELIEKIYHIHTKSKDFALKAEEFGIDFKGYLQPYNELKNAYEHMLRAQFVDLGVQEEDDSAKYVSSNLDKALGHEYRAFFDTADYLSMTLRQRIHESLREFSSDVISKAIPTYYSLIKPRILEINEEIAQARSRKDIGNGYIIPEVERYSNLVEELFKIEKEITSKLSVCVELATEEKKKRNKETMTKVMFMVTSLALGYIIGHFTDIFNSFTSTVTSKVYKP